jgi:TetR/AcrR family transcriptional regulator, transcriptional repressor of bet genes
VAVANNKRAQQVDAIIEATLRSLSTSGYAATSLQRIAEEAGTSKRMVLHYFESRDQLFDEVVRRIGRRVLAQVEQAVSEEEDPDARLTDALDRIWEFLIEDPGLHAAFFGLVGESVTNTEHRETIATVRQEYRDVIARVIADSTPGREWQPGELDSAGTLILGTMAGLTIDFLERGDTPPLRQAFEDFKQHVTTLVYHPPPPVD